MRDILEECTDLVLGYRQPVSGLSVAASAFVPQQSTWGADTPSRVAGSSASV